MSLLENPTPDDGGASTQDVFYETPTEQSEVVETKQEDQVSEDTQSLEEDAQSNDEGISLSDFAANLGLDENDLDVDDDGKIVFKTKIDGKEGRLKPSDFKTAYQKQGHLDNLTREAKAKLDQIKAQEAQARQVVSQRLQQLEDVTRVAYAELTQSYQSVDWNDLRVNDPAEFAAKQAEFAQYKQRLDQRLEGINQERAKQQSSFREKYIAEQEQKLIEAIPEWSNLEVGQKELSEVRNYGLTMGFTADEITNAVDHRFIKVLRKAKQFDDLEKSKPEIQKQVKKVQKVSRPGNSQKTSKPKSDADIFYS